MQSFPASIYIPGPTSPSGARKSVLVNRSHSKGGVEWRRILVKDDKEEKRGGGGREKKTLQEGREKGQSLVKRPSKHPQGSMANQILTHTAWHGRRGEGGRSNDKVEEEEEEVEVRLPDLSLCSREVARQCADRKQTSGNDRGRQCAFKTRQTVICHVFHAL